MVLLYFCVVSLFYCSWIMFLSYNRTTIQH
jgi:hypothetical protein